MLPGAAARAGPLLTLPERLVAAAEDDDRPSDALVALQHTLCRLPLTVGCLDATAAPDGMRVTSQGRVR